MIRLEKIVTPSPEQWEAIIRGMRNPMNSWDRSDSYETYVDDASANGKAPHCFIVGEDDYTLMEKLVDAGSDHRKFLRMIPVYIDITAPLYWWKEYDTYKVGTVANSCSTMHTICERPLVMEDFSIERITSTRGIQLLKYTIDEINENIALYCRAEEAEDKAAYFVNIIQMLPSSFNQKRTAFLNYEVLRNIYRARKNHKLKEWRDFCRTIKDLPYSELITR